MPPNAPPSQLPKSANIPNTYLASPAEDVNGPYEPGTEICRDEAVAGRGGDTERVAAGGEGYGVVAHFLTSMRYENGGSGVVNGGGDRRYGDG